LGFINSLFGDLASSFWTVAGALLLVVVLIVFLVWVLKFVLTASRTVVRGRNRRIGVTESVMVDAKRQLLLIRRDDVEHLVLTGGPQDLIVEAGIPLIEAGAEPDLFAADRPPAADTEAPAGVARPSFAAASSGPPLPNPADPAARSRLGGPGATADQAPGGDPAPVGKLRQISKRSVDRGTAALRYPGLLRPITRHRGIAPPPADNKSDPTEPDSDMSSPHSASQAGDKEPVEGQDIQAGGIADATEKSKSRA